MSGATDFNRPEADPDARQEQVLLESVLARLGIQRWDLIIAGDGSGNGWLNPCGWAATLIDRNTRGRRLFYGAMNCGSVNLAESMPYLQAIQWYDVNFGSDLLRQLGSLQVHLITDSQTVAQWCRRAMQPDNTPPRKGLAVWAALREYRRVGYLFHSHWAPRQTTQLNWAADLIAGLSRREVQASQQRPLDASVAERAAHALDQVQFLDPDTGQPVSIYAANPSAGT